MAETEHGSDAALRAQFADCEVPEHVEDALKPILKIAGEEADITSDEWEDVLFSLDDEVEFGEADWLNGSGEVDA